MLHFPSRRSALYAGFTQRIDDRWALQVIWTWSSYFDSFWLFSAVLHAGAGNIQCPLATRQGLKWDHWQLEEKLSIPTFIQLSSGVENGFIQRTTHFINVMYISKILIISSRAITVSCSLVIASWALNVHFTYRNRHVQVIWSYSTPTPS